MIVTQPGCKPVSDKTTNLSDLEQILSYYFSSSETLETGIIYLDPVHLLCVMYNYCVLQEKKSDHSGEINATTRLKFLKENLAACPTSWCLPRSV